MFNGIGLSTPRGSGTNGHVQRSLASIPISKSARERRDKLAAKSLVLKRGNNVELSEHDKKREVEVLLMELRVKLEDQGVSDTEIEELINIERLRLKQSDITENAPNKGMLETHKYAELRDARNEKAAKAFGISSNHTEGAAFDRELQAKLKEQRIADREKKERLIVKEQRRMERREEGRQRKRSKRDDTASESPSGSESYSGSGSDSGSCSSSSSAS